MLSLKERIRILEEDLVAEPSRISVYHDMPFAILRYDPHEEWDFRHELGLLEVRLSKKGRVTSILSMADLLWQAIKESEGLEALVELERERGFSVAQEQVTTYLSDPEWRSLPKLITEKLSDLDPGNHIVFLTHTGAMAPAVYHMSRLLDELHGKIKTTVILCYPGTLEGTTGLCFMGMKDREAFGNYRVKIYG
ncbi:MAG: BREX protein BrxB domain-containing protein [Candidatus Xenobiia bacterium LiM19]